MATEKWEYGWQWRAACRGRDGSLFFPPSRFERPEEKRAREKTAKDLCSGCSVQVECLEYALRIREPYGVWGGLNEQERRRLLREQDEGLQSVE